MPAILIEFGFMDYEKEAMKMLDPNWYEKLAEDTCKGICKYLGITYKKDTPKVDEQIQSKYTTGVYRVDTNDLNVREKATADSKKVGVVHKGDAYTIVKISGNFGYLKSGLGWVHLGYCKKV